MHQIASIPNAYPLAATKLHFIPANARSQPLQLALARANFDIAIIAFVMAMTLIGYELAA